MLQKAKTSNEIDVFFILFLMLKNKNRSAGIMCNVINSIRIIGWLWLRTTSIMSIERRNNVICKHADSLAT